MIGIWDNSYSKLQILWHLKKKVKPQKEIVKEIFLKADRYSALFAIIIAFAEVRELSMKEVLAHPPGPLPWSLAAPHGSLKATPYKKMFWQLKISYIGDILKAKEWSVILAISLPNLYM